MKLLILRHGETAWTISGQHTGLTELDLTAHGRDQATAQGRVIRGLLGAEEPLVLVSPRQRTRQSANLALETFDQVIEPALVEFDYGDYEGLTHDQIDRIQPGWSIWDDGCPGGETVADVAARADSLLARIAGEQRPIVMVTHGHTSRIIAARALGLPATMGSIFDSAAGSLSVLGPHHGRMTVQLWNHSAQSPS